MYGTALLTVLRLTCWVAWGLQVLLSLLCGLSSLERAEEELAGRREQTRGHPIFPSAIKNLLLHGRNNGERQFEGVKPVKNMPECVCLFNIMGILSRQQGTQSYFVLPESIFPEISVTGSHALLFCFDRQF